MKKKKALKNNIYAVKLLWNISPKLVVHYGIKSFLGYFEWLFYSAFFIRYVINALEKGEDFRSILVFIGITIAVFFSMNLYTAYLTGDVFPTEAPIVNRGIYTMLFQKSRNVELNCFENSEFYDKYTLAMEHADQRILESVQNVFSVVFGAIASVCAFIFMYRVDNWSIAFILLPIIGNFYFNRKISKIDYDRNKDMAIHNRKISYINRVMYLTDYAKEIRLTNVFELMRHQYIDAITGVADVTKKYTKRAMVLHWMYVMFTFTFIFEGLLIYGSYRTLVNETLTLSQLSVITTMMVSTTWILIGFTDSLTAGFKNGLFLDYLRSFMEYEEKIPEDFDGADPGSEITSIVFDHVSFSYGESEVLHDLNFEFRGGKTYALVGHNGAGKTTIIKLLLRFYDPTEGTVRLNGRDIREYNLKKYRALFATAFQDNRMFSMSVKDNVLLGDDAGEKTPAEIEEIVTESLKMAGVYEKVMSLPKGLDTILTKEFDEDGAILSGGEFQKIVVARAFARNCPIKLFDEPSSALDPIAEYKLFENILKSCKDRTAVFISHRLSSVQNADWVYLLENGSVKEEGSHAMLMQKNGSYAEMYNMQAKNYLSGDNAEGTIFGEVKA